MGGIDVTYAIMGSLIVILLGFLALSLVANKIPFNTHKRLFDINLWLLMFVCVFGSVAALLDIVRYLYNTLE